MQRNWELIAKSGNCLKDESIAARLHIILIRCLTVGLGIWIDTKLIRPEFDNGICSRLK